MLKKVGAITIIQPWAEVILHHGKNVENRQKNSHFRGAVALHASQMCSRAWFEDCHIEFDPDELDFGAVVGFANLVDVITKRQVTGKTKKWFGGKFGLVLENVVPLTTPVPMKGKRGVWTLAGKELDKCLCQLGKSQLSRLKEFKKVA